jgi:hypothetical protein
MPLKNVTNHLNNWINPFSQNYKNSVKNFDKLGRLAKVLTVVSSIFCGLGFIVGGIAAFRGIVSWLQPGESSTANKVYKVVKARNHFSPVHPAEKPTGFDHFTMSANDSMQGIMNYLDERSLRAVCIGSKKLLLLSEKKWQFFVEQRLGLALAAELKQSRGSWRAVMVDLNRPFAVSSNELAYLGFCDDRWGDKPELEAVHESLKQDDPSVLEQALIKMKNTNKCNQLNSKYFGSTPLTEAAWDGNVKQARLLIKYGAKDALRGG